MDRISPTRAPVLTRPAQSLTIITMPAADEPAPISVAIICCDNQQTIGRTLDSVSALARQIVAVDSGSTDGTLELLKNAGVEIIHQDWLGFGPQKNLAMSRCAQPWTLFLDSDESVEPALADSIRAALTPDDADIVGFQLDRAVFWAGKMLRHAWRPEWKLRLVRTGAARWSDDRVHESLDIDPAHTTQRIVRLRGQLRHDAIGAIPDLLARQVAYAKLAADDFATSDQTENVLSLLTSPMGAWLKQMVLRQAWRDGWRGWGAASIAASASLMKHLALLERSRMRQLDATQDRRHE